MEAMVEFMVLVEGGLVEEHVEEGEEEIVHKVRQDHLPQLSTDKNSERQKRNEKANK